MRRTRSTRGIHARGAAPAAQRTFRLWRLAAFLVAVFAMKLVVVTQLQYHPLLQPDSGLDTAAYVRLAQRVIGGDLALGPGLYYMSPLYIYFLAATLWVSDSFTFVRLAQIALGTAAVGCVFVSARAWFGERAAWIAAILAALTGVFTFYEVVLFQSSLDTFLTSAALACLASAFASPVAQGFSPASTGRFRLKAEATGSLVASAFRRKILLAGSLFGLQILNRPNVIVAIAGVVLVLLVIRRVRVAALVVAGVCIALAPVVLRNAIVSHQLALSSSQGGLNLYIGNNADATGQYNAVPGVRANIEGQSEDTRRVAEQATGRPLTDSQVSAYFTGLAYTWIREHPVAAAKLFARKLALVFNAQHQWLDFSYPYYARDAGTILRFLFIGPWLLVPLGLTGLIVAAPASPKPQQEYLAWAAFVPFYAIGVALFFVGERYRLPLFVPLCVTAGAAVERVARAVTLREVRTLVAAAAVVVAAAVCAGWPFHLNDGRFDERLRLSKVLMNRGDYGGAAMELEAAHRIDPAHTVTEFNLGMALVSSGRAPEGIAHIRHAIEAGVPINGARYALASTLRATGDTAGAAQMLRTFYPAAEDSADSCFQVGLVALDSNAPDVAERYFRQALVLRPGWKEAQQQLDQLRARIR